MAKSFHPQRMPLNHRGPPVFENGSAEKTKRTGGAQIHDSGVPKKSGHTTRLQPVSQPNQSLFAKGPDPLLKRLIRTTKALTKKHCMIVHWKTTRKGCLVVCRGINPGDNPTTQDYVRHNWPGEPISPGDSAWRSPRAADKRTKFSAGSFFFLLGRSPTTFHKHAVLLEVAQRPCFWILALQGRPSRRNQSCPTARARVGNLFPLPSMSFTFCCC